MRHYVEIHTSRADGALVIERTRLPSPDTADIYADRITREFEPVVGAAYQNDFGEPVVVVVTQHGEHSQVREGVCVT